MKESLVDTTINISLILPHKKVFIGYRHIVFYDSIPENKSYLFPFGPIKAIIFHEMSLKLRSTTYNINKDIYLGLPVGQYAMSWLVALLKVCAVLLILQH